MPRLVIEEYWEKVIDERDPRTGLRKVLKGEYELKSIVTYHDSRTLKEFRRDQRKKPSMIEQVGRSEFKHKLPGAWGISSYQVVRWEDD